MKKIEIIWKFIKFRFWHPQAGWDRVLLCYFWGGLALVPAIVGFGLFQELGMVIGGIIGIVGLYKILDQYKRPPSYDKTKPWSVKNEL